MTGQHLFPLKVPRVDIPFGDAEALIVMGLPLFAPRTLYWAYDPYNRPFNILLLSTIKKLILFPTNIISS